MSEPFIFVPHSDGTDREIAILKERVRLAEQFNALDGQFAETGAAVSYLFQCLQGVAVSMDAIKKRTEVIGALLERPDVTQ